ncbi:MAG: nicotinate-nucleotide adenylyltransferase [Dehalococcoidia bacterium]|nr:nicotinate-nucleotide adenylyltransferase [Dehalococcoidia bacterium]
MRVGVLGGTFDPIHIAHLVIAEEARVCLALEEVVFVVAGAPWMKADYAVSPADLRLQMVRLAVASNPFFRASAVEVDRPGPTYTVDTMQTLRQEWGPETEIFFLMGMDALADLPRWKDPGRFLQLCAPVVFGRPGLAMSSLDDVEAQVPGMKKRTRVLDGPSIGVSSTEIRSRVAQGKSIRYLVPATVERFIAEYGLYCSQGISKTGG